jgi:hypothetical protein
MHKIIQIYPCLLKLSRKQESVTDGRYYYIPSPLSWGDNKVNLELKKYAFEKRYSIQIYIVVFFIIK